MKTPYDQWLADQAELKALRRQLDEQSSLSVIGLLLAAFSGAIVTAMIAWVWP